MRTYAIGDIHGQINMLHEAHARISKDRVRTGDTEAPILHLGDLVDRGPDSNGVVQYLMDGITAGENWVVLQGNHDRMFLWFLEETIRIDPHLFIGLHWLEARIGGIETLASYGVDATGRRRLGEVHAEARARVPPAQIAFLEARPTSYTRGDVHFVHAGVQPDVALDKQNDDDLIWIRDGFLDSAHDFGKLIVHGHTALMHATRYPNRVNLDSSAAYNNHLTAAVFEGQDVWQLTDSGREEIPFMEVPKTLPEAHFFKR